MELGSIAKKFKIPVIVIGLTIVAIGTSMPEMVVSTAAAISGHSDMSIGNVVGSNIANLLFILGACAIIKPLKFKKQTKLIENFIAIATTIILCLVCMIPNYITPAMPEGIATSKPLSAIPILQITRAEGIFLLIAFALFIGYTIWISKKANDEINAYLNIPKVGYYTYFNFGFTPYEKGISKKYQKQC